MGNRRHADWLLDSLEVGDTVCLLDLDKFKHANDTHAHCVGDAILAGIGATLRASLGTATHTADASPEHTLSVADTALYAAKDQRRTTAAGPSDQAGAKPQRRSLATVRGTAADPATEPASTRGDHEVAV